MNWLWIRLNYFIRPLFINLSGFDTKIFEEKWVDNMAADALAPRLTRSSAATMQQGSFYVYAQPMGDNVTM